MSNYKYAAVPDPYCYPNSEVLINRLNIKDVQKLAEAERKITVIKLDELAHKPIRGMYGFAHLKNIHAFLFSDLYSWAGKPREQGFIGKQGTIFCRGEYIESEAKRIFGELSNERKLRGLPYEQFISRFAYYAAEINVLHPFREGNGRTTREFLRQLAAYNGYKLLWAGVAKEVLLEADIQAFYRNYAPLVSVLKEILSKG